MSSRCPRRASLGGPEIGITISSPWTMRRRSIRSLSPEIGIRTNSSWTKRHSGRAGRASSGRPETRCRHPPSPGPPPRRCEQCNACWIQPRCNDHPEWSGMAGHSLPDQRTGLSAAAERISRLPIPLDAPRHPLPVIARLVDPRPRGDEVSPGIWLGSTEAQGRWRSSEHAEAGITRVWLICSWCRGVTHTQPANG